MTDISTKILKEIKAHNLRPRPKWIFSLRESGIWALVAALIVLFGLAASLFWLFTAEADMGPLSWLTGRPLMYGHGPGLFLLILIIGASLMFWNIRNTKHGYKYNLGLVALGLIVSGAVLASLFGLTGFNGRMDRSLAKMPFYQSQQQYMVSVWQQPSEGRLTGEITWIESSNNFTLQDFAGKSWSISSLNATWRHNLSPEIGLQIKMTGSQLGSNGFEATDIRPFMPMMNGGGCAIMKGQSSQDPQSSCKMMGNQ